MGNDTRFDVVGISYHVTEQTQEILHLLAKISPLKAELEREPDNSADENAIKVMLTDKKRLRDEYPQVFGSDRYFLGYLRRGVAAVLAPRMDGETVKVKNARLESLDVKEGTGVLRVNLAKMAKS